MGVIPVRALGKTGVITDVDPFNVPIGAFSMGVNVRFEDGKIGRAPIWRKVSDTSFGSANFLISYKDTTSTPRLIALRESGTASNLSVPGNGGTVIETALNPVGYTPTAQLPYPYTAVSLNDVVYVNREDRVPWYMVKSGSAFANLPTWDSSWRAKLLRTCGACLVALNVTKGAVVYPQMVKWSDFTVWDTPPGAWVASTTNSAGENVLAEMSDPIVDAQSFRNRLMIYSERETWAMDFIGGNTMFQFSKIFDNGGAINANCTVFVDGVHYVFGPDFIWKHDGVSKTTVSQGFVNSFIYNNMDKSRVSRNFVYHNPKLNEILFCYTSGDSYLPTNLGMTTSSGCNRAAVYNYRANTWYFYDLPWVGAFAEGVVTGTATYDSILDTYDSVGGTYQSFVSSTQLATIAACAALTGSASGSIRDFEPPNSQATNSPADGTALFPCFMEQYDIDFDALQTELYGTKLLRGIYPVGRFETGASPMTISVGFKMSPNEIRTYQSSQTFNGLDLFKCDFNLVGRILAMKMEYTDNKDFSMMGFDADLVIVSER